MTEQELTAQLKEGNNLAREELYKLFAGQLLALAIRYVGNREEAEDVLHDGFLLIFDKVSKFTYKGSGSLSAWLQRVFTNHVLSYLSKERKMMMKEVDEVPDPVDEDEAPPSISTDTILSLITELPTGFRTVLNLYLVEGWSHAEIAAKLGIKESTSASQYLRAKKLLREKITNYLNAQEL